MNDSFTDTRWDIHTERQISVAKAGVTAVTVLNTGSWFALLSQVGNLQGINIGATVGVWALGAFLGTFIWVIMYSGTILQYWHDSDRNDEALRKRLDINQIVGVVLALSSLGCFAIGAIWLSISLA